VAVAPMYRVSAGVLSFGSLNDSTTWMQAVGGGVEVPVTAVSLSVPGHQSNFEIDGFYIRVPAEHSINSITYAAEFEFVYFNTNESAYLIVSFLVALGKKDSEAVMKFTTAISDGGNVSVDEFNTRASFWEYTGTITFPPCTPATWLVSATPMSITTTTLEYLSSQNFTMPSRPLQQLQSTTQFIRIDQPFAMGDRHSGNWKVAVGVSAAVLGIIFIILIIGAILSR